LRQSKSFPIIFEPSAPYGLSLRGGSNPLAVRRSSADPAATHRLLKSETAAARELAGATRFPVPEQVALGEPGPGYPLPWSVQAWLPGRTGDEDDTADSVHFARDLAEFIAGVRAICTRGRAFTGRGRV
jgi:aminoglycoside phosphotransferase (APT) family kinase protein